jgi:hypothetical protein
MSSNGTPLFISNWIDGSLVFQFSSTVPLKYIKALRNIAKNLDIYTNIKNLPTQKCLGGGGDMSWKNKMYGSPKQQA